MKYFEEGAKTTTEGVQFTNESQSSQQTPNYTTTTTADLTWVCYETRNLITGETYAGVFSYDANTAAGNYKCDKYIGQGITYDGQSSKMKPTEFTENVTAYGYGSFQRKDLFTTTDEDQAFAFEANYVDESYVANPLTLNQREGGRYGKLGKSSRKRRSVAFTGGGNPRAKRVLDPETGKVYPCIKDAAKKLKINYHTLRNQINNNQSTLTLI